MEEPKSLQPDTFPVHEIYKNAFLAEATTASTESWLDLRGPICSERERKMERKEIQGQGGKRKLRSRKQASAKQIHGLHGSM